jgi:hypothetical protein
MKNRVVGALFLVGWLASLASAQVPAGGEFQANTYTTSSQLWPSIASDAAGNFVVAWQSWGQDGSGYGVFAQRHDASGVRRGSEFRVNTHSPDGQWRPSVASDAVGNFVVTWQSYGQDGSGAGVFAQRYDASGAPRGDEFRVNTYVVASQYQPSVASDALGNFVVAWVSNGQDGSGSGVFAQRYDASGAARGSEFRVNSFTTDYQRYPVVASDAVGNFVVAWLSNGQDGDNFGVFAQRYDSSGVPREPELRVNTFATSWQLCPSVASDAAGNFVVAWASYGQDGSNAGIFAQRYDASGATRGTEFQVNTFTPDEQRYPFVAADAAGNFVVAWSSNLQDADGRGVFAQRYDASGVPRGAEFRVNSYTTGHQRWPVVASDPAGNLVVAWTGGNGQDGGVEGVFGQRYGGLLPAALSVDPSASGSSDGNAVLEPGETAVVVAPSWRNVSGAVQSPDGSVLAFTGPPASGVSYTLQDSSGGYSLLNDGDTAQCDDCYQVGVTFGGSRPATHWDAIFTERLSPDVMGQTKPWLVHLGESFTDVPKTSGYYRFIETLLHKAVTGGCTATTYCPTSTSSRQQMSIFALVAKEGAGYLPPACGTTPMFADVPVTSPYCKWVEELARRGVVGGCGGGNYCPTGAVTRAQMPIFVLKTLDPTIDPPACGTPMFGDVPASSPYCKWVEELARRGVVSGCGGGNYCPTSPVNRAQMAVFISATFGLTLYGP